MMPDRINDLIAVYNRMTDPYVRLTITEMVIAKRAVPPIEPLPEFRPLIAESAKADHEELRSIAAFAAAYYPDAEHAQLLLKMMDDRSEIVQGSAVFSLGEVARRIEDAKLRQTIYDRLVQQLGKYGNGSKRTDREWGNRVVAESLLHGFGPKGHQYIAKVLNGDDAKLADLMWRVLFQPNDGWNYYGITLKECEELSAYHPAPPRRIVPRKTYEAPANITLISQDFERVTLDPTGKWGSLLSPGGRWSAQGSGMKIAKDDNAGNYLEFGVNKLGKSGRVVADTAWDMPDKRLRNRLRGHFPIAPPTYSLTFGVVELTADVRKTGKGDALAVALSTAGKDGVHAVGFSIARDGGVQIRGSQDDTKSNSVSTIQPGAWQSLRLRLDFNTGKAQLLDASSSGSPKPLAEFAFDTNKQYRAVVITAEGDPESTSHLGKILLTQSIQ
jgi:hypothetical protein